MQKCKKCKKYTKTNQNNADNAKDIQEDVDIMQQDLINEMMEDAHNDQVQVPPVPIVIEDQPLAQEKILYDDNTGIPYNINNDQITT